MALKKYQPERADFLINTDWGIPRDGLTMEQARDKNLRLFHDRWATMEDIKQLRLEYLAYRSVRVMGSLLMVLSLVVFVNIVEITKGGALASFFTILYGMAMFICGIGLFRYARFAQKLAVLVFLSLFVLPFIPPLTDDKGAPFLIAYGVIGLYYVLRKSARKIFAPLPSENSADMKPKNPVIRKVIYALLLLIAFLVIYIVYDMSQAKQMAVDACKSAEKGMTVDDFLAAFSVKDYKVIRRPESAILVPKRGMGRNHCTVLHDGMTITGSKAGFTD
jgi:hypothetical protein